MVRLSILAIDGGVLGRDIVSVKTSLGYLICCLWDRGRSW
jgi:hypothetical protein